MAYPEERYARDLYAELAAIPNASSAIEGAGVHWHCTVRSGDGDCSISCFDVRGRVQYCIAYRAAGQDMAIGRTDSKQEAIASVRAWLKTPDVRSLYDQFTFVDQNCRTLQQIRDGVLGAHPAVREAVRIELRVPLRGFEELWLSAADRACRVTAFHYEEGPRVEFLWDGTPLFPVSGQQLGPMALMIRRWLVDMATPSVMADEFPELTIGRLAAYYESGNGIEGEFILSWDDVQRFFGQDAPCELSTAVLEMIAAMRSKGYDRLLRAGVSMWLLILSRSRRHGLHTGQPAIGFYFTKDGMAVRPKGLDRAGIRVPQIQLTPEVEELLRRLAEMPID